MRFGSWNVNGLKSVIKECEFRNNVNRLDIVGLVETHHEKHQNISLKGFKYFDIPGIKNKNKGRRSGGLILYYKKKLTPALTLIKSTSKDILWVRIDKRYFTNLQHDIYLALIYSRPGVLKPDAPIYQTLTREILKHCSKGKIILLGDMNARIGNENDFIVETEVNTLPLPYSYTYDTYQPRLNQDKTLNACGRHLLDLCKMSGLRILNGRTPGDSTGAFTCIRAAGKSTVDYIIADQLLLSYMSYFTVHTITDLSDHCLLEARLQRVQFINNELVKTEKAQYKPKWPKFIWDNDTSESFKLSLLENDISEKHTTFLTKTFKTNINGVNSATDDLSDIIQSAGKKVLKVRYFTSNPNKRKKLNKPWFNNICKSLKGHLTKLAQEMKKHPYDKQLHTLYMTKRKEYKLALKRQQNEYKDNLLKKLSSNYINNPREFWNILDSLKNTDLERTSYAENIPPNQWIEHFKSISKTTNKHNPINLPQDIRELEKASPEDKNLKINAPITISEIKTVIKNMKNNKASGEDMILNEMLKHGQSILLPAIAKLFNLILVSQCFPNKWNISAITPLHRKGSQYDPDNYRGISINSCLGKCFTSVLSNRLIEFIQENNIISDHRAAFKKNCRTSDHVFVMKSIINKYCIQKKGKLYTCFVDFRKAFDSVWRDALLYKLLKLGVKGNFYSIIKHMYSNTLSCVKLPTGLSDSFLMELGIRQGDCLSPILFNLFINDIYKIFDSTTEPVSIGSYTLNHLLYADDLVLISESKEGLQRSLNKLNDYANMWNLEINTSKTNTVIFQKYGRKSKYDFHLGRTKIACSDSYNYLGVNFENNCNFKKAAADLKAKATKATFSLLSTLSSNNFLDIKLSLNLYDKLITPISNYACEIWLPNQFHKIIKKEINNYDTVPFERLHMMFCKYILGVNKSTSNTNVRRELGRSPLIVSSFITIIKYWSHILNKPHNSLLFQTYLAERENNTEWIKSIQIILKMCGLESHWETQTPVDEQAIIKQTKIQLGENFYQYSSSTKQNNILIKYESSNKPSTYISYHIPIYTKRLIAKFRLQSNRLEIVRGRYSRPSVPKENRICKSCNLEVDDEIHFVTKCPSLDGIRDDLFKKLENMDYNFLTLSDLHKTTYLLNPENEDIAMNLGLFLHKAKQLRQF